MLIMHFCQFHQLAGKVFNLSERAIAGTELAFDAFAHFAFDVIFERPVASIIGRLNAMSGKLQWHSIDFKLIN